MSPRWTPGPARIEAARLTRFARAVAATTGRALDDVASLQRWSVERPDEFWAAVWDQCGVQGEPGAVVVAPDDPWWRTRFFPDARLNVAETLLAQATVAAPTTPAIIAAREDGHRATLTWAALRSEVGRTARALLDAGVGAGDRVAVWLPNCPEAVITMLAAASIGAVFSSSSPDFGAQGVLDRFGQIEPTVLVATDGYRYDGTEHDCRPRLAQICAALPSVRVVPVVPGLEGSSGAVDLPRAVPWSAWLDEDDAGPQPVRLPFDHPLAILYSSGTTGLPKCIVHRAGGILLKHLVEHQLHADVRAGDRVFYFTTTGWMMWNWLVSALATGATIVLYDGAPLPSAREAILWDLADELGISLFGTSAKYLDTCRKRGIRPRSTHDLTTVRTITSTGSPLVPEGFDYVYEHVKDDVHLASISGGTDLCGCLVGGIPTAPVWSGEIQGPAFGLDIAILDPQGAPLGAGVAGELVCRNPFPSMPLGLWSDAGDARYRATYFARFPGAWHQGDFAEWTEHGGIVIHGRSDATLNPGGVRIGTAEIYRQVEALDAVVEGLVIGQEWDDDTRVVLFVVLRDGAVLDDDLVAEIRARIRTGASPRHVPARVVAVPELPRTRSGKITELAVREVVHGRPVHNVEALANPEALDHFRDVPTLDS